MKQFSYSWIVWSGLQTYIETGGYRRVLEAARWLRKVGFKGDLTARMTVTDFSRIYRDVIHLLGLNLFNHVHWQLNVIGSPSWRGFRGWLESSYKHGLSKLVDLWVRALWSGKVLEIAPIQDVLKRLIEGVPAPSCSSGVESFAIPTQVRELLLLLRSFQLSFDCFWRGIISEEEFRKYIVLSIIF